MELQYVPRCGAPKRAAPVAVSVEDYRVRTFRHQLVEHRCHPNWDHRTECRNAQLFLSFRHVSLKGRMHGKSTPVPDGDLSTSARRSALRCFRTCRWAGEHAIGLATEHLYDQPVGRENHRREADRLLGELPVRVSEPLVGLLQRAPGLFELTQAGMGQRQEDVVHALARPGRVEPLGLLEAPDRLVEPAGAVISGPEGMEGPREGGAFATSRCDRTRRPATRDRRRPPGPACRRETGYRRCRGRRCRRRARPAGRRAACIRPSRRRAAGVTRTPAWRWRPAGASP